MLRSVFQSLFSFFKYSVFTINPEKPNVVLLDMHQPAVGRSLRMLLISFQMAGLTVYIRVVPGRKALSIAKMLRWHPNAKIIWVPVTFTKNLILCTDKPTRYENNVFLKKIYLHFNYSPDVKLSAGHYACPFIMHPQLYGEYGEHNFLEKYRHSQRSLKILFAGNYNADYQNSFIKDVWGKISRQEIIEHLRKNPEVKLISSIDEIPNLLAGGYKNSVVLIDNNLRVNQANWMKLLSSADFFICPPGLNVPMSHNLIESLAIGTIPLTNYAEWVVPNLKNGKNAILFSSLDELDQSIQEILRMNKDDVLQLRQQAITYYSDNLSHREFVKRLLDCSEDVVHLHLINGDKQSVIASMINKGIGHVRIYQSTTTAGQLQNW